MGPGSEKSVPNPTHPKSSPGGKGKKASNAGSKKGAWFYDQMQGSVVVTQNQYHAKSKPIPVKRSGSYQDGGKPGKISNNSKQQHQVAMRSSPVKGVTPNRPISLTPPNVPMALSLSPMKGTPGKNSFYAGAKFETNPSCMVLPTPPMHWTTPQRSQSQPSTPTMKSAMNCTPINLASLFGSPTNNPVSVTKSFPGDLLLQTLEKKQLLDSDSSDEEMKEIMGASKKNVTPKKEVLTPLVTLASPSRHAVNTEDLKKALGGLLAANKVKEPMVIVEASTCQGSLTPLKDFKEMSDQLKSLMKVAA